MALRNFLYRWLSLSDIFVVQNGISDAESQSNAMKISQKIGEYYQIQVTYKDSKLSCPRACACSHLPVPDLDLMRPQAYKMKASCCKVTPKACDHSAAYQYTENRNYFELGLIAWNVLVTDYVIYIL